MLWACPTTSVPVEHLFSVASNIIVISFHLSDDTFDD